MNSDSKGSLSAHAKPLAQELEAYGEHRFSSTLPTPHDYSALQEEARVSFVG